MSTQASTSGPLGQQRGIGFAILISIVTLGIYTFYWVFETQEEVEDRFGTSASAASSASSSISCSLRSRGS